MMRLPTFVATHEGPMNSTQEAYNQLFPFSNSFSNRLMGVGRSFVVDSTREFVYGAFNTCSDNPVLSSPYSMRKILRLSMKGST